MSMFLQFVFIGLLFTVWTATARNVFIVQPTGQESTLEYYLCNKSSISLNDTTLLLSNGNHTISNGTSCTLNNVHNLLITSEAPNDPAIVTCKRSVERSFTSRGFVFVSGTNLTLSNIVFMNCGGIIDERLLYNFNRTSTNQSLYKLQTVLLFLHSTNVRLHDITIVEYFGYAVLAINVLQLIQLDKIIITNSGLYEQNVQEVNPCSNVGSHFCSGSGVFIIYNGQVTSNDNIEVIINSGNISFNKNNPPNNYKLDTIQQYPDVIFSHVGGLSIYSINFTAPLRLYVNNTYFVNNIGGAISVIIQGTSFTALYDQCIFSSNKGGSYRGQGLGLTVLINTVVQDITNEPIVTITNSVFQAHRGAQVGSGLTIQISNSNIYDLLLKNVSCYNNEAYVTGDCMHIECKGSFCSENTILQLYAIKAHDNGALSPSANSVISLKQFKEVNLYGIKPKETMFTNNRGSAIFCSSCNLYLYGYIEFIDNDAFLGAALRLSSHSTIYFTQRLYVKFIRNTVYTTGGAIYIVDENKLRPDCAIQFQMEKKFIYTTYPPPDINLTFIDNSAMLTGHSLFGHPIYNCSQVPSTNFTIDSLKLPDLYQQVFNITSNLDVSSVPTALCICNETEEKGPQCINNNTVNITTYPGKTFNISILSVDSNFNPTYGAVYSIFDNSWLVRSDQIIEQTLATKCNVLPFNIFTNQTQRSGTLMLSPVHFPPSVYIKVYMDDCPYGFEISRNVCICSPLLERNSISCNLDIGGVTVPLDKWVGLIPDSNVTAVSDNCPYNYCSTGFNITTTIIDFDSCHGNRNGVVCGSCRANYSVVFGDRECLKCSNYWLFTLVAFGFLGVLLVIILFVLRISIATGTIISIIFYANVFATINSVSINQIPSVPAKILFVWLNLCSLNLGFPLCFYDGMTELAKAFLQFAFPLYLIVIVFVFIQLSRYSTKLARHTSHYSVQVLATLVFLSYAKVVNAIVDAWTFVTVETSTEKTIRWFLDGNIFYFKDVGHCFLGVTALFFLLFVILPYTILLTVLPFMSKYKWVNKMRPFLDAHFGPYKDKWRCWFGIRLCYLFIICIFASISTGFPYKYLVFTEAILLAIFVMVQAYIRPFRSQAVNILDLIVMTNGVLGLIVIAIIILARNEDYVFFLVTGFILTGVLFLLFWVIIIYHIYKVLKCRERCQRQSTNESIPKHIDNLNQTEESVNITEFTMYHDFDDLIRDLSHEPPELRESILSDEYNIN